MVLVFAPSDDAPAKGIFGLLVFRICSGAVPPCGAPGLLWGSLSKNGIGGRACAEGMLEVFGAALSCDDAVGLVRVLGGGFSDGDTFSPLVLAGDGFAAGAEGLGGGLPAPMFHTLRTSDLADARNPKRDGFGLAVAMSVNVIHCSDGNTYRQLEGLLCHQHGYSFS